MKQVRRWLKSFFGLSASQANGMMVLLPLMFLFIISEPMWRWWQVRTWSPDVRDAEILDSLAAAWRPMMAKADSVTQDLPALRRETLGSELFSFDPNTASKADLIRLGFGERLATRIDNYRQKGGSFGDKRDLLRIYGMDTVLYQRLAGYVRIVQRSKERRPGRSANVADGENFRPAGKFSFQSKADAALPFDINLADTTRLEDVRGIGQKLSRRIIKYRSALGGFVSVGQLREVFGLDSLVLEHLMRTAFVAPDFLPDRLDLNTADEKLLESHPYLTRQEARAIVAYRFQHGRFDSVSDLGRLPILNNEKVRKLEPYLKTVE